MTCAAPPNGPETAREPVAPRRRPNHAGFLPFHTPMDECRAQAVSAAGVRLWREARVNCSPTRNVRLRLAAVRRCVGPGLS